MIVSFEKYHGTGNDFILINSINKNISLSKENINFLCNRHLGIGADGLMLLLPSEEYNFEMKYFNSDGNEGSMCGNGGRSILAFAFAQKMISSKAIFKAIDGLHQGEVLIDKENSFMVNVSLNSVEKINNNNDSYFLNTGSPHHVEFVEQIDSEEVDKIGKKIRWSDAYKAIGGTNVNFVYNFKDGIFVRTFERGVEAETLSCGTGVTASAIAFACKNKIMGRNLIKIYTLGGELEVSFFRDESIVNSIILSGPVKSVFKGTIKI